MKRYLVFAVFLTGFCSSYVYSQQQALYSQFTLNKFLYNPAIAGSEGYTFIRLIAHEQWVGFEGSPQYYTATYDARIFNQDYRPLKPVRKEEQNRFIKLGNVGVGAQLFTEKTGPLSLSGVNLTYAYHVDMDGKQLSFGLSTVLSQYTLNPKTIVMADDVPDDLILDRKSKRWITDFNFGTFYSDKYYYAGYSITQILQSAVQFGDDGEGEHRIRRTHYIIGGYIYPLTGDIILEPSVLIKASESFRTQADISAMATYKETYWGGLIYRTGSAMSLFFGMQFMNFQVGYAFDYNLNLMRKYSFGSHELFLAVQLGNPVKRYKWLDQY